MAPFVALTGFMGSGKSAIGLRLAELLAWDFVDLDDEFVAVARTSISDFFAARGEPAFRARECDVLEQVLAFSDKKGLVLALGGGTLESQRARDLLAHRGGLVFLDVEVDEAWARARGTNRPLAVDREKFEALLAGRRATYEEVADWVLPVKARSIDELSREVLAFIRMAGDGWSALWGRRLTGTQRPSLIVGGPGALGIFEQRAQAVLAQARRIFLITDGNVAAAWGDRVVSLAGLAGNDRMLVLEPGEGSKNLATLGRCWDWLAESKARRDDVVVALGGGVVGDLAGFAAATYQRGLELWQVPTTLLAQVDSSVGGKTAIDLTAGKNLVGAFYQPDLVIADPVTLTTLSNNDFVGGLGEVVKHSLLMSAQSLGRLEASAEAIMARDLATVASVVKESVGFKTRVVQDDEREHGLRAILNLGHTVGHAIEVVEGYGRLSHGAAVALGLQVALAVSEDQLGLDLAVRPRVAGLCATFGLPTEWELRSVEQIIAATGQDKKARAGSCGFVGLRALGEPVLGLNVSADQLARSLEVIRR